MRKTKIEWTDYVFNPIKGLCPVNCKLPDGRGYCYARAIYKRFKLNPELRYEHDYPEQKQLFYCKPKTKVFVCSTIEIFHPKVKKEWRDLVFLNIENTPHITFQILTKMPENIDRPMPDNVHLGVSVTKNRDAWRVKATHNRWAIKFISFEPLLDYIDIEKFDISEIDWMIVGKLTGHGRKYAPKKEWIQNIVYEAKEMEIPVFLKDNLGEIWEDKLMQEFPGKDK